jgi:hypothetical protein
MPNSYHLRISNSDGTNPQIITPELQAPVSPDPTHSGFLDLAYSRQRNDYGTCKFTLPGVHAIIPMLVNNAQVEVWCQHTDPVSGQVDIPWYRDWSGVFKDVDPWSYTEQADLFTAVCYSDLFKLQDRFILWPEGTANRSLFTGQAGETIMKTLVDTNACVNATAASGRDEDGAVTGLSIEVSSGRGATLDWICHGENLLDNLKKLWAAGAGGDFSLNKTGPTAWQFQWGTYNLLPNNTWQLAANRSGTIVFSLENGNMADPSYRKLISQEKTITEVGVGSRVFRTGDNYNASTNKVEMVTTAPSLAETTAALNAVGSADMKSNKAPETLSFRVLQTPACQYGMHYWLGDTVKAIFRRFNGNMVIDSITRSFSNGQETLEVGLANV